MWVLIVFTSLSESFFILKKIQCDKKINLSQYLTNLMHKICFTISFISFLYMFRAHVLETCRGMK